LLQDVKADTATSYRCTQTNIYVDI